MSSTCIGVRPSSGSRSIASSHRTVALPLPPPPLLPLFLLLLLSFFFFFFFFFAPPFIPAPYYARIIFRQYRCTESCCRKVRFSRLSVASFLDRFLLYESYDVARDKDSFRGSDVSAFSRIFLKLLLRSNHLRMPARETGFHRWSNTAILSKLSHLRDFASEKEEKQSEKERRDDEQVGGESAALKREILFSLLLLLLLFS